MNAPTPMVGLSFGRLCVTARAGSDHKGQALWQCQCQCGEELVVRGAVLRNGHTQSCGCLRAERSKENGIASASHGDASDGKRTSEYISWASMKQRCLDPNHLHYDKYGGRGVKVCERWLNSYQDFLADMGRKPSSRHTLDRHPNGNGDYEPDNCRWATMSEQNRNRRRYKWKKNR